MARPSGRRLAAKTSSAPGRPAKCIIGISTMSSYVNSMIGISSSLVLLLLVCLVVVVVVVAYKAMKANQSNKTQETRK